MQLRYVLCVGDRRLPLSISAPTIIGRASDAGVTVDEELVSRRHLQLRFDGDHWVARDLGGLNGSFVNGGRMAKDLDFPIRPGTDIMLGHPRSGLRIRLETERQGAAVPGRVPSASDDSEGLLDGLTINRDSIRLVDLGRGGARATDQAPLALASEVGVMTIGRAADNTIVVHDPLVSGHHAKLVVLGPGRLRVDDLKSTNGTFVNGVRVMSQEVGVGSVITVGKIFFRVAPEGLQRIAYQAPLPTPGQGLAAEAPAILSVSGVSFTVPGGREGRGSGVRRKTLLDRVTFNLPPRSVLAVIGPSGAGKSTMLKSMIGALLPDAGQVLFNGLDMAVFAESLASQIGMVPQDDLIHMELTARQALDYAARLRFPSDASPAERRAAVERAIQQLGLAAHADTRIRQMSGGQRKRVSTAMELLTRPALLFLDEPTSGLDPNLDREVMALLRDLAHGTPDDPEGRTVIVITHSTANLDRADFVLLLAPGGKVAYFGPPQQLKPYFAGRLPGGDADFASIYELIAREPAVAQDAFVRTPLAPVPAPIRPTPPRGEVVGGTRKRLLPQTVTLLSRQVRLLASDRSLMLFTVLLPLVMGLVSLAVRADEGFRAAADTKHVGEPRILLVVLVFGAVLMGMVPSVRQLVGERPIFRREAGVGVRPLAYLASKVVLLGVVCLLQSILLVAVTLALNPHPDRGVWGPLWLELVIVVLAVAWTSSALGLLLSALVTTSEQVMPLMVVVLMLQLILCGGVIGVNGPGVRQVSWAVPARWGYAAGASTLDFNRNITCHAQVLLKKAEDDEVNKQAKSAVDKANEEAADAAEKQGLPAPDPKTPDVRRTTVDCATVDDTDPLWAADLPVWLGDESLLLAYFALYFAGAFLALRRQVR